MSEKDEMIERVLCIRAQVAMFASLINDLDICLNSLGNAIETDALEDAEIQLEATMQALASLSLIGTWL